MELKKRISNTLPFIRGCRPGDGFPLYYICWDDPSDDHACQKMFMKTSKLSYQFYCKKNIYKV